MIVWYSFFVRRFNTSCRSLYDLQIKQLEIFGLNSKYTFWTSRPTPYQSNPIGGMTHIIFNVIKIGVECNVYWLTDFTENWNFSIPTLLHLRPMRDIMACLKSEKKVDSKGEIDTWVYFFLEFGQIFKMTLSPEKFQLDFVSDFTSSYIGRSKVTLELLPSNIL